MTKTLVYMVSIYLIWVLIAVVPAQDMASETVKEISVSDLKHEDSETTKTAGQYLYQKKKQYQKKAEEKLHRLDEKIRDLVVQAENSGEKTKEYAIIRARATARQMKEKSEIAWKKLDDLKAAGSEKWESIKKEIDAILRDREDAYRKAVSKVKSDMERS